MFNLNIKSGGKKIAYSQLAISLKYMVDEKKLEASFLNLETIFNIRFSQLQRKNFLAEGGTQVRVSKKDGKPDSVIISKVKVDDKFSPDYFRNHLAGFLPSLASEQLKSLHIFIPKYEIFKKYFSSELYYYQTFVEGVILGNYSFNKYKVDKKKPVNLNVFFYADNQKKLNHAIAAGTTVMEGVNFTKELQNEPGSVLIPNELAKRVNKTLTEAGVKVTVFNEKEIKKRKMGGLLAVGMGSANPPRFIIMEYKGGSKTKKVKNVVLVGKGVTFDSGGISIKPASNMGEMKADMSGAAVVAGTVLAAAKAKLPINITGIIPSAENMPSGSSMRPGDVVVTSSGKSIEVDNTDAEGRMILSDALYYASNLKPDVIIDLATLTGACVVALGEFVAGLFTKDDKLAEELYQKGLDTYDRLWRMPMWDDYNELIVSDVADVKNVGGRWGGAITAAKFLEKFVDPKISWAHLDIAGPAMANNFNNYTRKYMTGFGVRLLFAYLSNPTDKKS